MKISVIIPNLNSPIVDQTIQSIKVQSLDQTNFEIIVVGVDDRGIVDESPVVQFEHTEHPLPPGAARNRGVEKARGELIAFIDADCIADKNWLRSLSENFQDSSIGIVGGGVDFDKQNVWTLALNISGFHEYLTSTPAGTRIQLPTINLMVRKDLFTQIGGFDEGRFIGEDSDFTMRVRKMGYSLYFDPTAIVTHKTQRTRLTDLLSYEFHRGKHSVRFDPSHKEDYGFPPIVGTRIGLLLSAPFFASAITGRIFSKNPALRRYWHSIPAVLIAKLAWCMGAVTHN